MDRDKLLKERQVWLEREFYDRGKDVVTLTQYGHQYVSNYRFTFPTAVQIEVTKEEYENFKNKIKTKIYDVMYGDK